jgi:rare lipoprotein A
VRRGVVVVAGLAIALGGCGLFARRPSAPSAAPGATQDGIASWYGPGFHGRRTSNGEIYDQYGLTAAHQTLPHGTWVRVTNRTNGRSVLVRINDRGPFVDDRIIDLSYAAAEQLDMVGPGTAPVHVEVVPAEIAAMPPPPAAVLTPVVRAAQNEALRVAAGSRNPAQAPAVVPPPAPYAVQIGAFVEYERARRVQRDLERRGAVVRLGLVEEGGLRYYRLRMGPFAGEASAARAARQLAALGIPALIVAGGAPR